MSLHPEINFPNLDRASVREFVANELEYRRQVAAEGVNAHQVDLDRQDQITAKMALLSEADQAKFLELYTQEMGAVTNALLEQAAAINANTMGQHVQAANNAAQMSTWISIIAFFAFVIFMIRMFKQD